MKLKFLLFFLIISVFSFGQTKEYNFKYVYYILTDKITGKEHVLPKGKDATVYYDTFYKSYQTVWTDSKNFRAGNKFQYIKDEEEMTVVMEEKSEEFYHAYHLESQNIFVLAPVTLKDGMIVIIYFTNIINK